MGSPDLSEFHSLSKPRDQRRPCLVAAALEQLDKPERAQLVAACAADKHAITTGAIRDWLAARGLPMSVPAITNHRRALCTCHG